MGLTQSRPSGPVAPGESAKATENAIEKYFGTNDFQNNMQKLSSLVDDYNEGDIEKLANSIMANYGLDESEKAAITKVMQPHIVHLKTLGYENIKTAFKDNKLYEGFVQASKTDTKRNQLLAESKQQFPMFSADIDKFVNGVTNITSREQFFKFHYLYSQIWIIMYIKTIKTAVTEFTTTSIDIFNKIEVSRTQNTKLLIEKLLALLANNQGDLDEADFSYFKASLNNLKAKIQEDIGKSERQLKDAKTTMLTSINTTGANDALSQRNVKEQGQQGQQSQKVGGFVRDGSRFPESFYAEPSKTFDQFGGQSFAKLNKQ